MDCLHLRTGLVQEPKLSVWLGSRVRIAESIVLIHTWGVYLPHAKSNLELEQESLSYRLHFLAAPC